MPTTLTACSSIPFPPAPATPRITKLGCVGMGEVVHTKLWPAVQAYEASLSGIVVCSLEPHSRVEGLSHLYHALEPDSLLPLDVLEAQGFLDGDTLWIIATPSACHAQYALQLAGRCRVALEKPLAATSRQARRLLPAAHQGAAIYPIDHKLFNASALAFIDVCRQRLDTLAGVGRIAGVFFEPAGLSQGRHQEDCIADVQGHLFTPVIAAYRATGAPFVVTVDQVWVATHAPDPAGRFQVPTVWTASRIQGRLVCDGQEVAYDFCQAKGAPQTAYGDPGTSYTFAGCVVPARSWIPLLVELREVLRTRTGYTPNFVLVNYYRSGRDSIGWHADDERDLGEAPTILSLSLGAERALQFRHREAFPRAGQPALWSELQTVSLLLGHGRLLSMRDPTNKHWKHQLPRRGGKQAAAIGARLNLTWRRIVVCNK